MSTRGSVLVVDDEPTIAEVVSRYLARAGYETRTAGDGPHAIQLAGERRPDLVVLDLGLPKVRGLDVLRQVRADNAVPVIVLSGLSDEADRIIGLELGADDYVVKPFSPRELVARVRSVLRRSRAETVPSTLQFPQLELDLTTREVRVRGKGVELRRREFDLLAFLCASPRQVFTREQLLRHVWDSEPEWQGVGTVSEHVHRVRAKVEVDPAKPCHVLTVRGVGYRFVP